MYKERIVGISALNILFLIAILIFAFLGSLIWTIVACTFLISNDIDKAVEYIKK